MRPLQKDSVTKGMRVQRGPRWRYGEQDGGMIRKVRAKGDHMDVEDEACGYGPFQCGTVRQVRIRPADAGRNSEEIVDVVVKWDATGLRAFYALEMVAEVQEMSGMSHEERMQRHEGEMAAQMAAVKNRVAKKMREVRSRTEAPIEKMRAAISGKRKEGVQISRQRRAMRLFTRCWRERSMYRLSHSFSLWLSTISDRSDDDFTLRTS